MAWAGPVGPTLGKARIILDGRLVATVDTYRSVFRARDIIWAATMADGRHTLRIQVLGTAGRPTVAVDGLYVLRELAISPGRLGRERLVSCRPSWSPPTAGAAFV